jgi:hypothetical protein
MEKMRVGFCLAVGCVVAWALVTAYHVEPKAAAMSGWTGVSGTQYLIHLT